MRSIGHLLTIGESAVPIAPSEAWKHGALIGHVVGGAPLQVGQHAAGKVNANEKTKWEGSQIHVHAHGYACASKNKKVNNSLIKNNFKCK